MIQASSLMFILLREVGEGGREREGGGFNYGSLLNDYYSYDKRCMNTLKTSYFLLFIFFFFFPWLSKCHSAFMHEDPYSVHFISTSFVTLLVFFLSLGPYSCQASKHFFHFMKSFWSS